MYDSSGPSKVYAAMIEALHRVDTVHVTGWTTRIQPRHTIVGDQPLDTTKQYPIEIWEWFTEDGEYRMFEQEGPIIVWQEEDRRYEYQAHKDTLYIDKYTSPFRLSVKFQSLTTEMDSLTKRGLKVTDLGTRFIDGKTVQGLRGERGDKCKEIWFDTETNLMLANNAYALENG